MAVPPAWTAAWRLPIALGSFARPPFKLAGPLLFGEDLFFLGTGASFLFPGEILEPLEDIGALRRLRFLLLAGNLGGRRLPGGLLLRLFLRRGRRPALAHRLERIPPHWKGPRLFFLFLPFGLLRRAALALLLGLLLALAPFEQRRDNAEENEQQE